MITRSPIGQRHIPGVSNSRASREMLYSYSLSGSVNNDAKCIYDVSVHVMRYIDLVDTDMALRR